MRTRVAALKARLTLPALAAPMFLVSGPELVIAACKAGIVGSFPTINARELKDLEQWFERISGELAGDRTAAPWSANVIVHSTNQRLAEDLKLIARYKPEVVITAMGSPAKVVEVVRGYGGLVFADVNTVAYAKKAADAGADGLVLVSAGAGGHTGQITPFAFVPAVREFFDGAIVVGGSIVTGAGIRAVEVLGADLAYLGTRMIATPESLAPVSYKEMLVNSTAEDIICSASLTGVPANFLAPSLVAAGLDPKECAGAAPRRFDSSKGDGGNTKAWRDIWSAGQGVGRVKRIAPVAEVVAELKREYERAKMTP